MGSFSTNGWNGIFPVPGASPTAPPKAVDAGEPNALVAVPPNGEFVAPPPKGLEVVVLPPKVGFVDPKSPPPLLVPPKGDDAAAGVVEAPNPLPKPDVPAVAVPPPNKLPPVVAAGVPKPPVFAPNALFVVLPKAPVV